MARTLTQEDFDRFARLSRDDNPIHCDPVFARTTHFGATVAHGMFLYSLILAELSRSRPQGYTQATQTLMFPAPTLVGDTVRVEVESDAAGELAVRVRKQDGSVTAQGTTRLLDQSNPNIGGSADEAISPNTGSDHALYGLALGQSAAATRTFTDADLGEYADLSGDRNPLVASDAAARAAGFDARVLPGPLLSGMFSDLLGTRLPGRGTGWMKQSLRFVSTAHPGEALTASVTITRLRRDKELVNLASRIVAGDGRTVVSGESLVLVRNLAQRGADSAA
jgi:acyl dehydratase